jgi:hypothetical protein
MNLSWLFELEGWKLFEKHPPASDLEIDIVEKKL